MSPLAQIGRDANRSQDCEINSVSYVDNYIQQYALFIIYGNVGAGITLGYMHCEATPIQSLALRQVLNVTLTREDTICCSFVPSCNLLKRALKDVLQPILLAKSIYSLL